MFPASEVSETTPQQPSSGQGGASADATAGAPGGDPSFGDPAFVIPSEPGGYELGLPDGFELPKGVGFTFDPNDPVMGPMIADAQDWAHQAGLPQAQFNGLLGLYTRTVLAEDSAMRAASEASMQKLGTNGAGRVDAVHRFLDSRVGEGRSQHLKAMIVTAEQVEVFETLMRAVSSQGAVAPGGRRDPAGSEPSNSDLASRLFPNSY